MTPPTDRPRPEHFLSLIREQKLGRLKVYLGFAPGVGKTFEMLQEGQRLKRQGVDAVIAVVGRSGRAGWRRWFGLSPLDRLLAAIPTTDVVVSGG